jgi:hypothetical protein
VKDAIRENGLSRWCLDFKALTYMNDIPFFWKHLHGVYGDWSCYGEGIAVFIIRILCMQIFVLF